MGANIPPLPKPPDQRDQFGRDIPRKADINDIRVDEPLDVMLARARKRLQDAVDAPPSERHKHMFQPVQRVSLLRRALWKFVQWMEGR